jgi:hypothetical protein
MKNMNLTKDEAVRLFREHWKYLAETGGDLSDKRKWLAENGYKDILFECFLCEYTAPYCEDCPIIWEDMGFYNKEIASDCARSYYGLWQRANSPEERKRLAKIISELPEKEG